jgi:hypothetical protein
MKVTGIKLACRCLSGDVNTYHGRFETTVEEIIDKFKISKDWIGGKFIQAYIEFDNNGTYYKVFLDLDILTMRIS